MSSEEKLIATLFFEKNFELLLKNFTAWGLGEMPDDIREDFQSKFSLNGIIANYKGELDGNDDKYLIAIYVDLLYLLSEYFCLLLDKHEEYKNEWHDRLTESYYQAKPWNYTEFTDVFSELMTKCWGVWHIKYVQYFLEGIMVLVARRIYYIVTGTESRCPLAEYFVYESDDEPYIDRFYFSS